ncbi:MAG TPA: sigma 54-interacting transcriptional regulator, partial [Chloroflexota bacterium]
GELPAPIQAKLLRVLQEGEVRPVGEDQTFKVDVRIIAATHRDLLQMSAEGKFREDLYYRLKVVHLSVPPLRERREDIPLLARHFLGEYSRRFGVGPFKVTPSLLERLNAYSWPGNVRELENVIERAIVTAQGGVLAPEHLVFSPAGEKRLVDVVQRVNDRMPLRHIVAEVERHAVSQALDLEHDDHRKAADILDMPIKDFEEKLVELGIKR